MRLATSGSKVSVWSGITRAFFCIFMFPSGGWCRISRVLAGKSHRKGFEHAVTQNVSTVKTLDIFVSDFLYFSLQPLHTHTHSLLAIGPLSPSSTAVTALSHNTIGAEGGQSTYRSHPCCCLLNTNHLHAQTVH